MAEQALLIYSIEDDKTGKGEIKNDRDESVR